MKTSEISTIADNWKISLSRGELQALTTMALLAPGPDAPYNACVFAADKISKLAAILCLTSGQVAKLIEQLEARHAVNRIKADARGARWAITSAPLTTRVRHHEIQ